MIPPSSASTTRKVLCTSIAVGLGVWAFAETQTRLKEDFEPIVDACTILAPINLQAFEEKYHPYEPLLGGSFVCILTQFIHRLVLAHPAGLLLWGATFCTALPTIVLLVLEAGRSGIHQPFWNPLRYPSLVLLLGQVFGISVAIPLLWVPAYIWGRSTPRGTVSVARGNVALLCLFPSAILSVSVFVLNPASRAWTLAAGALGGPLLAAVPLMAWNLDPQSESQATQSMVQTAARAYSVAGVVAFTGWAVLIFVVFQNYGLDYVALQHDLWISAPSPVQFMAIDAIILYGAILTYVAYIRFTAAIETLFQTLLFGPGAALAMILAELEMERMPLPAKRVVPVGTKKEQ